MTTSDVVKPGPYVVMEYGFDDRHFDTFDEALTFYRSPRRDPRIPRAICNADKCDGECEAGEWRFYDGLTDEEKEQL